MHGFGGMGFGMGWIWIIGLIVIIAIIWLVVRATNPNTHDDSSSSKSALDILKERYARGEINKSEFEERKKNLM
jgi:putative membrane protein